MNAFAPRLAVALLLLLPLTAPVTAQPGHPPVRVEGGLISGTLTSDGAVQVFRGIPFAAPPVGDRRWKAPQPVAPWRGVRACTAFGPSPMQPAPAAFSMWSDEFLIPKTPISEDCLYLNVWTVAKPPGRQATPPNEPQSRRAARRPTERRPVFVWIYGGGFNSGGSAVPIYDGAAMARKGIVFVSINYRVGPFGFLAHPALTRESGQNASGNYGLLDQLAALKWVRANIAAFGGDPDNVTIGGQSAGAMSVNCLVASPLAKGLFNKAIAESGGGFTRSYATLPQAEEAGLALARSVGVSSLADLRAVPASVLLKQPQGRTPIIDGYVLPASIAALFAGGTQNAVTLLTGWNDDEGLLDGPIRDAAAYQQGVRERYGQQADEFLRFYPASTDAEAASSQQHAARDTRFGVQNYRWATIQCEQGKPAYVYRFTRKLPATGVYAQYGAFHTGEVAYVLDNVDRIDHTLRPLDATDTALARIMSAYWANFVKTGNPNGAGLPTWPVYTVASKQIMDLGAQPHAVPLPDAPALDFLLTTPKQP